MSVRSRVKYCSWCLKHSVHNVKEENTFSRNIFTCTTCKNHTVTCRAPSCNEMAKEKPKDYKVQQSQKKSIFKKIQTNWSCEFCAQHDGTIPNFKNMSMRVDNPSQYKAIFEKDKCTNFAKAGIATTAAVGTAVMIGTCSYYAAPGIASALGSTGLLGAASTGTAISSLSGAALSSASLAAIGTGSIASGGLGMGAGALVIAATGSAIGSHKGMQIGNSYYNSIQGFGISQVREGKGPAIVLVNGFMQQKDQDAGDWLNSMKKEYPKNPVYLVNWESKSMAKMGEIFVKGAGKKAAIAFLKKATAKASKGFVKKLNPLKWAEIITDLAGNPWHSAMAKAGYTGVLVAEILARTNHKDGFILMGHSLGARVIFYLLSTLATREKQIIKEVHLLGGAVDRDDKEDWQIAEKAVEGEVYNYYSKHDETLKFLYKGANALQSDPVGLGPITHKSKKITNINCSDIISGKFANHMDWKTKFGKILKEKFEYVDDIGA